MALTDASTGSIGVMWVMRNVRFMPIKMTRTNCPKRLRTCRRKLLISHGVMSPASQFAPVGFSLTIMTREFAQFGTGSVYGSVSAFGYPVQYLVSIAVKTL